MVTIASLKIKSCKVEQRMQTPSVVDLSSNSLQRRYIGRCRAKDTHVTRRRQDRFLRKTAEILRQPERSRRNCFWRFVMPNFSPATQAH